MDEDNAGPIGETWHPVPPQPTGRKGLRVVAVVVAVLLVVGGGVGAVAYADHRSDVAAAKKAAAERREAREAEEARLAAEREREAAELAEKQAAYDECLAQLGPLVDALGAVDARLAVGLSQSDYGAVVGEASVAYGGIEARDLAPGPCLSAGAKLENALNSHITANNEWNDCIVDFYCDIDSIDPSLQRKWSAATRQLEAAEDELEGLDPEAQTDDYEGDQT